MEFYNLDRKLIKRKSTITDNYYAYTLGNRVEITSIKKRNSNDVLSRCLSSRKVEDKLMIKYQPSCIIYFDMDFIDNTDTKLASCYIEVDTGCVFIGRYGKYPINTGVLCFSAVLSANDLVERERLIYSNSQISQEGIKSKIRILSVGLKGDNLFGLYFIPKERGIALSSDSGCLAYSVNTWVLKDFSDWSSMCLEDWFKGNKIMEV